MEMASPSCEGALKTWQYLGDLHHTSTTTAATTTFISTSFGEREPLTGALANRRPQIEIIFPARTTMHVGMNLFISRGLQPQTWRWFRPPVSAPPPRPPPLFPTSLGKTCLWRGLRPARAFRCSVFFIVPAGSRMWLALCIWIGYFFVAGSRWRLAPPVPHYASGSDIFSLQAQGGGSPHLSLTVFTQFAGAAVMSLPPPLHGPENEQPSQPFFGTELQYGPICQVKRPCPRGTLTKEDVAFLKAEYGCSASVRCRDPKNDQTREVIVSCRVGGLLENTAGVSAVKINVFFKGPCILMFRLVHIFWYLRVRKDPLGPEVATFQPQGAPFDPETGQVFNLKGQLFRLKGQLFRLKGQLFCLKGPLFRLKGELFSLKGHHSATFQPEEAHFGAEGSIQTRMVMFSMS